MVAARKATHKTNDADTGETLSSYPPTAAPAVDRVQRRAIWQEATPWSLVQRPDTLWWTRRFAGTADQVRVARRFVGALLADGDNVDEAAWVAGELAANAIRHSRSNLPGGWFEVEVVRTLTRAEIRVTDAGGEQTPKICDPEEQGSGDLDPAECGRGLYGIGAMATRYGSYVLDDGRRVVWARLDVGRQTIVGDHM